MCTVPCLRWTNTVHQQCHCRRRAAQLPESSISGAVVSQLGAGDNSGAEPRNPRAGTSRRERVTPRRADVHCRRHRPSDAPASPQYGATITACASIVAGLTAARRKSARHAAFDAERRLTRAASGAVRSHAESRVRSRAATAAHTVEQPSAR